MLVKLFSRQNEVVDDLLHDYAVLDTGEGKHSQAIHWLKDGGYHIKKYQNEVRELLTSTANAIKDYESLLDMKQKQSNVVEAFIARMAAQTAGEQNRAIMIFTIFTIIFVSQVHFISQVHSRNDITDT